MLQKKLLVLSLLAIIWVVFFNARSFNNPAASINSQKIVLGQQIFFDEGLSNPVGQSCASCHRPDAGFSDPSHLPASVGAVASRIGLRNSPSITYSAFTPVFHYNATDSVYEGGLFLEGRTNTLAEQAKHPFLNSAEMNNQSVVEVFQKLQLARYYPQFKRIYGEPTNANHAFANIADALASFERSSVVNSFTSKFDYYLQGMQTLNNQELRGLALFNDPKKGNCAACHPSTPDPLVGKVLFTDFTYDNIGLPAQPGNQTVKDKGLGGVLKNALLYGSFKVPGLRNVALSQPYGHNGYFNTLDELVHFYIKRDVEPFGDTDYAATVNHDELGNLRLTMQEEKDIVAFLKALTDGYKHQ